ncbi:50S ribosomal protein L18 [Candidatus Roizmanbacteria bacterium]|nr:50S ribosomal protein L18 [Candidatus Roizmanbacteria bacterium]
MKKLQKESAKRVRIAIFRSNRYIYGQIINDSDRRTLIAASDIKQKKGNRIERAFAAGEKLGEAARAKGITKVWFDRGSYRYHGRIKAFAEGARKAGLEF